MRHPIHAKIRFFHRPLHQGLARRLLYVIGMLVFVFVEAGGALAKQSSQELHISSPSSFVTVGQALPLEWRTTYAASELSLLYSKDDGRTWREWGRFETGGKTEGVLEFPVAWEHFAWYYFSYSRISLFFSSGKTEQKLELLLGKPLRFRVVDADSAAGVVSEEVEVTVNGPPWWVTLHIGIFLFATLLYFLKASWDTAPRRDLSFIFNVACTACLVSKTAFLFAFVAYLLVGLAIWHRAAIIKNHEYEKYGLTSVYSGVYYVFAAAFALLLLVGLVLRVRDFLFP